MVTELATAIGAELGVSGQRLEQLRLAAELHDVGKLAVPVTCSTRQGRSSDEEWELVRQHPVVGQRDPRRRPAMQEVGLIVRATHERCDGDGYADGLAGEEIPLAARIIAVCDAYAAMTHERPYRAARAGEEALAELRRCAGSQFDPEIVAAFCRHVERSARPPRSARRAAAASGRAAAARKAASAPRS